MACISPLPSPDRISLTVPSSASLRGTLNGVTYIISGGGGASLDTQQQDIEHITVYASEYQFCTIDINTNKLHFESVKPNGDVIDKFDLSK